MTVVWSCQVGHDMKFRMTNTSLSLDIVETTCGIAFHGVTRTGSCTLDLEGRVDQLSCMVCLVLRSRRERA